MSMKFIAASFAALLLLPATALADGAEDGNHGLQAMEQGNYDAAIADFSHAIRFGRLEGNDKEFAYANRGKAYLKKSEYSAAIADLDYARQMKPDDNDAQADLLVALGGDLPASALPNRPKVNFWHALSKGWNDGMEKSRQQQLQQQQSQQQQQQ
jgi:tetratricopeptide (TPR) repeat protein